MEADQSPSTDATRYEAFVRQFVAREGRVRAFLRSLLPAWEDVDDALQETSLVAWRKFGQFEEGTDFLHWLLAIARFEALKVRRQRARSPLVFSDELLEMLADEGAAETEQLENERRALAHCQRLRAALLACLERRLQAEGAV